MAFGINARTFGFQFLFSNGKEVPDAPDDLTENMMPRKGECVMIGKDPYRVQDVLHRWIKRKRGQVHHKITFVLGETYDDFKPALKRRC